MDNSIQRPIVHPLIVVPFGILAVSTASIFIRFIQAESVSSLVIAALRLTLAAVILSPFALSRNRHELVSLNRKDAFLAVLSGILLAVHFATWITSLEYTSVASSVVFVSTSPLWVALIAPIAIKENVPRGVLFGMLIALVGGVIIGISDSCELQINTFKALGRNADLLTNSKYLYCPPYNQFVGGDVFFGDCLALAGAISGAGYILFGRKLREKMTLLPYIFVVYGISAVVLIIVMFVSGASPYGYSPRVYYLIILLAVVPQLIGHSTINWSLRYLSAAYVSITLLGEPIGSAILAYIFLSEVPSGLMIFGAILILLGIFITSRRNRYN